VYTLETLTTKSILNILDILYYGGASNYLNATTISSYYGAADYYI